jgi:hypothetical protein
MKKYLIGLGCSWTQGEGGYPDDIWRQYNGKVQLQFHNDHHLRKIEHENSWVNVLCKEHFPEYTSVNLGVRGSGNISAVKQLHFCDIIDWENSTGIIVLMLSGFERLDFLHRDSKSNNHQQLPDYYSVGEYKHYKWRQAYPSEMRGESEDSLLWTTYAKILWSEEFVATNQLLALLELQEFAKNRGFKIVIANAFNMHDKLQGSRKYIQEYTGQLANKFDWSCYFHDSVNYVSFMEKLVQLDGKIDNWTQYFDYYKQLSWPTKYLTNCFGSHPTIEGYKVIANELANFIKNKNYA